MNDQEIQDAAEEVVENAYQMYFGKPSEYAKVPFPMYSYDNAGRCFWRGFCEGLLKKGASPEQVEMILRSKNMRWMFDAESDKIMSFGETFADTSYIEWAKEQETQP
jgi:hypothetical protein